MLGYSLIKLRLFLFIKAKTCFSCCNRCETCGSAFSQAAHLKNHAKVHSGEKPFKCDICTAAFADRFALKRHRGIHDKYGIPKIIIINFTSKSKNIELDLHTRCSQLTFWLRKHF